MSLVDVVIVTYNSRAYLRDCVAPLVGLDGVGVTVVDNASTDEGLDAVSDLPIGVIRRAENDGFAAGCNDGWRVGDAPYVLFLNPDARTDELSLRTLVTRLEHDASLGLVAPRIEHPDGTLAWSQRRFPRVRSTYARALFLHRLFPQATWTDEVVRDSRVYQIPGSPEWVSGACVLVRRSVLRELEGWDDGFFLYGEDIDLCRRLRQLGFEVGYEPSARVVHLEGRSAPRSATLPHLATSRIRYNHKHRGQVARMVDRAGMALGALTHIAVTRGGRAARTGHARALRVVLHPKLERR